MYWLELRKSWQTASDPEAEPQAANPPDRVARLRRKIASRDLTESIISVLILPFFARFGWLALTRQQWWVFGFCMFLVVAIVYIPWRLWRERRKLPRPDPLRPVKDYLQAEREAMRAQAKLLEGIWWWYLGPLGLGVIGLFTSIRGFGWSSFIYAGFVVVIYFAIGKGNSVAARTQFREAMKEIDQQLAQLENGGDRQDRESAVTPKS